jgi:hypothetical protein
MAAAFLQEVIAKLRQLGSYLRLPLPAPAEQTLRHTGLLIVLAGLAFHARKDSSSGALAVLVVMYPVVLVLVPSYRMMDWVPDLMGLPDTLAHVPLSGN